MDLVLDNESRESEFIVRYAAVKAHSLILRGNALVELKKIEDGRKLLLQVESELETFGQHSDAAYVYLELLIGLGRAFYLDGIWTRALSYYKKVESTYKTFKELKKVELTFPELLNWNLDEKAAQKWTLKGLYLISTISLFTCAAMKRDEAHILEYTVPHLMATVELAQMSGETFSLEDLVLKILEFLDIFINCGYLKQCDHLLAVAAYNLQKERRKATDVKEQRRLDLLLYKVALKYTILGCHILQKSAQLIEIKSMEAYGGKAPRAAQLKVQVSLSLDIQTSSQLDQF